MTVQKKEYTFLSSNQCTPIYLVAYIPDSTYQGYVQIVHDINDHIERYEAVLRYYAERGFISFGIDHLVHGRSVSPGKKSGEAEGQNNHLALIKDIHQALLIIMNDYVPKQESYTIERQVRKGLHKETEREELVKPPLRCLIGVGLGAALVRSYAILYADVNLVVLCGDAGFSLQSKKDLKHCEADIKTYGEEAKAEELMDEMVRRNNKPFQEASLFAYRVTSRKCQKEYERDALCQPVYTNKLLRSLLQAETAMTLQEWLEAYPLYLTTFLISGKNDPLTQMTTATDRLIQHMVAAGCKNVFRRYYPNSRHDVLFDQEKAQVCADIYRLILAVQKQQYGTATH